jgi:3-keto-disaccharide hydrolase
MTKYLLALVMVGGIASGATVTLTPEEKSAGWMLLFDGESMRGWVDPRQKTPPGDSWSIEDGCLKAKSKPRLREDLFSQQNFRDFELVFEWRISPKGNSGVKYRIQDHFVVLPRKEGERFEASVQRTLQSPRAKRQPDLEDYVVGFEYQITDDAGNTDARSSPKHMTGALYDMVAPAGAAPRPLSEFNQSRIIVQGNRVEHWLNGVKVVDSTLDAPEAMAGIQKRWSIAPAVLTMLAKQPKKDCPISLQNHNDEAWFRNIKIRRLK